MFASKNMAATATGPWFDAVGTASTSATTPASIQVRGNFVAVFITCYTGDAAASCTCGGAAMTNQYSLSNDNSSTDGSLQLFTLLNPPKGSCSISPSWSSNPSYVVVNAMSFGNVRTVGTYASTYGYSGSTAFTQATNTQPGGLLIEGFSGYSFNSAPLSNPLGTNTYSGVVGGYLQLLMAYQKSAGTSTNGGATTSSSGSYYSYIGIGIT